MTIQKQIELMEQLVDNIVLNEQFFNPSVAIVRIKGEANIEWTDHYDRRCKHSTDKYDKALCKEFSKRDSAQRALGRIRGLTGFCNKAKNPTSCVNSVRSAIDSWNKRITHVDEKIAVLKRNYDKYKAKLKMNTKG